MRRILPIATLLLAGCMLQNVAPTERLGDAVNGITDETRWGRVDLAAQRVDPRFRAHFSASHTRWGRQIQIADAEVTQMTLADDGNSAVSVVAVSWYQLDAMDLRLSVVEQRWKRNGNEFVLSRERIVDGDNTLLAVARPARRASR